MQNLDTKYPGLSAQVEYLTLNQLADLEKEGEGWQMEELGVEEEEYCFAEKAQTNQQLQGSCDFDSFVVEMVGIGRVTSHKGICSFVEHLVIVMVGEVLEYIYHVEGQRVPSAGNLRKYMVGFKTILLTHLFAIVLTLWVAPLTITILLGSLYYFSTKEEKQSEFIKWSTSSRRLSQSSLKLKLQLAAHPEHLTADQDSINSQIKTLTEWIKHKFCLRSSKSSNSLDILDELVHQIVQRYKQNNRIAYFLQNKGWYSMKVTFWRVKFENYQIGQTIELIEKTVLTIENLMNRKQKAKVQKYNYCQLYYAILVKQLNTYSQNQVPGDKQKERMEKMIKTLKKQIMFRKIMISCLSESYKTEPRLYSEDQKDQEVRVFQPSQRQGEVTLCYKDSGKQVCDLDDFKVIASRLELVLKEHEEKQEGERQDQNQKCENIVPLVNIQTLKAQRRSFGIPLIPPVRDMSAFYIE